MSKNNSSIERCKLSLSDIYKTYSNPYFPNNTAEIKPFKNIIGQTKAIDAINIALNIKQTGYNIFAVGDTGIGKKRIISQLIKDSIEKLPKANIKDHVFAHNFNDPQQPIYISLAAGEATILQKQVKELQTKLPNAIKQVFKSPSYKQNIQSINNKYIQKESELIHALRVKAQAKQLDLVQTTNGASLAVIRDGNIVPPEEIAKLSIEETKEIEKNVRIINNELVILSDKIAIIVNKKIDESQKITNKYLTRALKSIFSKLIKAWKDNEKVINWITDLNNFTLENYKKFIIEQEEQPMAPGLMTTNEAIEDKLNINILVDNSMYKDSSKIAPIEIMEEPTYGELFGQIEYQQKMGEVYSNYSMIRSGAIHRANGGYLLLNARKLLESPILWHMLKYAIKTNSINFNYTSNNQEKTIVTVAPEDIELDVKIILMGEHNIYQMLWEHDPEFKTLFKVIADFQSTIELNDDNALLYTQVAKSVIDRDNLKDIDNSGLCALVEYGMQLASNREQLSANIINIADIIREANYYCNSQYITSSDIYKASNQKRKRISHIPDHIHNNIKNETILINTTGTKVGQINGLSVIRLNEFLFGQPQRISCVVSHGKSGVIDIEKSANLSGSIHSKGIMILSSYLYSLFHHDTPFQFLAHLTFEQSYGMIDGDSASAAQLISILSALSKVHIKQNIAITGSVDQTGRVQAIGGVNEKILGFFNICKERNFEDHAGVIIPKSNIRNLMLAHEIQDAVKDNKFSIYAVESIDEAIQIMTDNNIGYIEKDGLYNKGSIARIIYDQWVLPLKNKKDSNK